MSIRKRDVHFSDWTKVRHALVCNNVQGITETSSFDDVRTFLINSESGSNPFYYYVCYIKETKEIYTHGQFYDCLKSGDSAIPEKIEELESTLGTKVDLTVFEELQSDVKENELVTARALTELNEKKADSVDLNAIKAEIEENEKVAAKAFMDLNERKLDKSELDNIDLSNYVDLDTYYNNLNTTNSSINLKADKTTVDLLQTTVYLKANQTDLDTLSAEVEENEDVTAAALTELHENKADKSEIPDVSTFATKDDINLKQDILSASDFATINGTSVFGGENAIVIEEPDHYASGTATVDGSGFVTSVTTNEAGHVTKVSARAITDNDITSISASKITGTIEIDNLPTGALERLFVVESEAAAISATVQEGDVVQVTGNNNKMYFCISNTATTFATKFKEFTAGTATSVPWSGITGKPTGIDGWGDRIGVIESGYASQSWVGENYLSKSGGRLVYSGAQGLEAERTDGAPSHIMFIGVVNGTSRQLGGFGMNGYNDPVYINPNGIRHKVLTAENYSDYALSVNGGTVNGSITANSFIGNLTGNAGSADFVAKTYANENINFARDESKIRLVSGVAGNSTDLGFPKQYTAGLSVVSSYCGWQMVCYGSNIDYNPYYRSVADTGTWGHWRQIAFLTDNVASATKLATPRTIWGQPFDGTGDITGPLHLGNNISIRCYSTSGSKISTLILDPSNTLLLGYDMSNIGGTVLYGKALSMRYGTSRTMGFLLNEYGNVAIGGATADEKLHVYGNVKASGSMYAVDFATTSDNRLKDFVSDIYVDFESIKKIPKKYYYWKDKSMGEDLQIGTSAQELAKVYPECVHYDETNDRYSVNYQKLSIVALAAIDKLHDRISELESKLYDKNN